MYVLGQYIFALYLLHWYVMRLITKITNFNTKWIIYRLSPPFIIFVIGITWLLRKIPIIKNIVP